MTVRFLDFLAFLCAGIWCSFALVACAAHISRTSAAIRCPECPPESMRTERSTARSTVTPQTGSVPAAIPDGVRRPSTPEYLGRAAPEPSLYTVTAYSHGCTMPRPGRREPVAARGANGRWPVVDVTVAADTTIHPMGSALIVAGKWRIVGDKGRAIKGRRLDLFTNTCAEARAFGVQRLPVWPVPPATVAEAAR